MLSPISHLKPQKNPFEYGRELEGSELVDRQDELHQVRRTMQNTGKLFLIGPRRYGKTSLLATAAAAEEAEHAAVVLRFDAERYGGLDELGEAVLTAATRRLTSTLERAAEMLGKFASRLKPSVSLSLEDQQVEVSLGRIPKRAEEELPVLTDVLDAVEKMAAESRRQVTVIIDEFQAVVSEGGEDAERQIRATVQRHRHVGYIFAGSATRLLADMTSDPNRAFYKLGARLFLGPIPRDQFIDFITHGFDTAGLGIEPAAVEQILNAAEDVPYSVQRLAHECWEQARVTPGEPTTPARVTRALEHVIAQESPAYTQIWTQLSKHQKRALQAVVAQRGEHLMTTEVSHRYRIAAPTMQTALQGLEKKQLVRQELDTDPARYRLQDPLFGHWMSQGHRR